FAASRILLPEHFGIDRRLQVHCFVISLEDGAFADTVVGREHDFVGKRNQGLLVALAHAADVNRDRGHAETRQFAAQNLGSDPTGYDDPVADDDGVPDVAPRSIWISLHWLISSGFRPGAGIAGIFGGPEKSDAIIPISASPRGEGGC